MVCARGAAANHEAAATDTRIRLGFHRLNRLLASLISRLSVACSCAAFRSRLQVSRFLPLAPYETTRPETLRETTHGQGFFGPRKLDAPGSKSLPETKRRAT